MGRVLARGLYWFFSLSIASFSFVVVAMITTIGFEQVAPHLVHYMGSLDVPLYGHIVFGPLALMLAPFQFWAWLRLKHRQVHRVAGYFYVASILIAGVCSVLILPRFQGSVWAATGFVVLATLWVGVTVRAAFHARAGRYDAHRAFMMRSAALTFAAVVLRLMTLPLMATGMTLTQSYDVTAWLSWIVPLAYVEWRLRYRRARAGHAELAKAH
jgi:hypothetical protein